MIRPAESDWTRVQDLLAGVLAASARHGYDPLSALAIAALLAILVHGLGRLMNASSRRSQVRVFAQLVSLSPSPGWGGALPACLAVVPTRSHHSHRNRFFQLCGQSTNAKIDEHFPGAMTNGALVEHIQESLEGFGFGATSLLATSLCSDEVNRSLEHDLAGAFGSFYAMGGLSGVPFGGVTAFGVMASHIPAGGSCLVVYGPHVGVDAYGKTGDTASRHRRRRRHPNGARCSCPSAAAAAAFVADAGRRGTKPAGAAAAALAPAAPPVVVEAPDAQQLFVGNLLLPYGERLKNAAEPATELAYALYDAQTELIDKIVAKGCGKVKGDGKIALLGGIQINTPTGMPDYFMPIRFDVLNNLGQVVEKISKAPSRATVSKLTSTFPRALPNMALVDMVRRTLAPYGYGKSSLLCTSFCSDEMNRQLETDFQTAFGDNYRMGGLAGFAFGGATGFKLMAGHIPDGGSCLVVYGPHVGVDSTGKVGTVDRRGCEFGGNCCGSGIAAAEYVEHVMNGWPKAGAPLDPMDAQQAYVCEMLLPYGRQLQMAADPGVELPYALFHAQDRLMKRIVSRGCGRVAGWGKIALLGGIQINTPDGVSDYFLPLRFEVLKNNAEDVDDLLQR